MKIILLSDVVLDVSSQMQEAFPDRTAHDILATLDTEAQRLFTWYFGRAYACKPDRTPTFVVRLIYKADFAACARSYVLAKLRADSFLNNAKGRILVLNINANQVRGLALYFDPAKYASSDEREVYFGIGKCFNVNNHI